MKKLSPREILKKECNDNNLRINEEQQDEIHSQIERYMLDGGELRTYIRKRMNDKAKARIDDDIIERIYYAYTGNQRKLELLEVYSATVAMMVGILDIINEILKWGSELVESSIVAASSSEYLQKIQWINNFNEDTLKSVIGVLDNCENFFNALMLVFLALVYKYFDRIPEEIHNFFDETVSKWGGLFIPFLMVMVTMRDTLKSNILIGIYVIAALVIMKRKKVFSKIGSKIKECFQQILRKMRR